MNLNYLRKMKVLLFDKRPITPKHVIWAYRIILEREPENQQVVLARADTCPTIKQLRTELLASPEFRLNNPEEIPYAHQRNIVIKEISEGLRLFVDLADVVIGLNIVLGSFEVSETAFIRETVQPGQSVIDLGTNVGYFTMHMAERVGPAGQVYGFEPLPRNADMAARSIAENRFEDRVVLHRVAVGAAAGKTHLLYAINTMHSGGSYLVEDSHTDLVGHALHEVDLVTLDQLDLRRPISFIKMDIEGAEALACRGAEAILRDDRPIVMAELNPDLYPRVSGCTPTEFITEMAARGYACYLLENGKPGKQIRQVDYFCTGVFLPKGMA